MPKNVNVTMNKEILFSIIIGFGAFYLFEKIGRKKCDCKEKQSTDPENEAVVVKLPEIKNPITKTPYVNTYKAEFVNYRLPERHIVSWNDGKPKKAIYDNKSDRVPRYVNLTIPEFETEVEFNKSSDLTITDFYNYN